MGKRAPSPPPAPDPRDLINAQADANRITQFTPQGNLLFGYVGDQGQFVQGRAPDDSDAQSAAFTQETPFQTQCVQPQKAPAWGLATLRLTG
jgi:hypothetical protein